MDDMGPEIVQGAGVDYALADDDPTVDDMGPPPVADLRSRLRAAMRDAGDVA